eukprot:gene9682-biopygen4338
MKAWLHNTDSKQTQSLFQNVLVHRCDNVSLAREDECLQLLLKGRAAICIGLPGIGKSVSTTPMLVKALETIVQRHRTSPGVTPPDGFEEVYYRVGPFLYKFAWNQQKQELGCEAITKAAAKAKVMERFQVKTWFYDERRKMCLIVEMKEKEVDPEETAFYTGSSKMAFERTFKTLDKADASFFVIEPPSDLALRAMYWAAQAFSSSPLSLQTPSSPFPPHINTTEKFEAVLASVGPVPRILFGSEINCQKYKDARTAAADQPWKDVDLDRVSVSNVGDTFKYFAAPFIRKGAPSSQVGSLMFENNEQRRIFQFRSLSDACKLELAKHVQLPRHIKFLQDFGSVFELLGAVAAHAGCMTDSHALTSSTLPERCRKENWLIYDDLVGAKVMSNHRSNLTVVDIVPRCNRTHRCGGNAFARPVWQLEEGVLYFPGGTQHPVVECFCVNHTTQRVVGIQVTVSVFSSHPFDIANVDHFFDKFSMDEEAGKEYKFVLLGVNDMSLENPTGLRFVNHTRLSNSLLWWKNETQLNTPNAWPHSLRTEAYLARIRAFDMPAFELSNPVPKGKMLTERYEARKAAAAKEEEKRRNKERERGETG